MRSIAGDSPRRAGRQSPEVCLWLREQRVTADSTKRCLILLASIYVRRAQHLTTHFANLQLGESEVGNRSEYHLLSNGYCLTNLSRMKTRIYHIAAGQASWLSFFEEDILRGTPLVLYDSNKSCVIFLYARHKQQTRYVYQVTKRCLA